MDSKFTKCSESHLIIVLLLRFYEAQIEDVTSDGQCTVIFTNLGRKVSEVCLVALLKPLGKKKTHKPTAHPKNSKTDLGKVKRQLQQEQREYLKKKQQKKKERLKELEEEREKEKTKWQQFHNKVIAYLVNNIYLKNLIFNFQFECNYVI